MSSATASTTAPYAAPARRSVSCCRRSPARYLRSYADVHLYGLISLAEACQDAGLDHREAELRGRTC